ncbi:hypothetical protein OsI_27791 [Oryza sativa Indica Group]|uniref:Uncharacterized protein n=1 Tax=Oryza sativa subsp. indica TaxID=39946 RepID=B8BAN6_ORYSI|nr:hypothetical protein OsI_27791 [Oryza sativa Indica Group]
MAATYNLLFIYTAELFPTAVRNTALGWMSQASQTGDAGGVSLLGNGRWDDTFKSASCNEDIETISD